MSAKVSSPRTLAEINKKILEIKKKIQLSEGQRKAAFEEYEAERKINLEKIQKLKKEILELKTSFQKNKDDTAAHRVGALRLDTIVGPLTNKTMDQVKHILDLQIIDQTKHLDIIRHKVKQVMRMKDVIYLNYVIRANARELQLSKLAKNYRLLLSEKPDKEVTIRIDNPFKKKTCTLQNSIHRIEVQWREGEHIRRSYRLIRASLLNDSGKFESVLQKLEERLQVQQRDIRHLQKICIEAAKTRSMVRNTLEREERSALNSGKIREKQSADYKNLVAERKIELERLERRIFQSGKLVPPKPDTCDETEQTDETTPEEDQEVILKESFHKLKDVTGATSTEEVLNRFRGQGDTKSRLDYLKKTTEVEKKQLELKQAKLIAELERYKYAQEKDKEKNNEQVSHLQQEIEETTKRNQKFLDKSIKITTLLQTLCKSLFIIYLSLKDASIYPSKEITDKPEQAEILVKTLFEEIQYLLQRSQAGIIEEPLVEGIEEHEPSDEEMLMPPSYGALLRRTPVPFQGQSMHISVPSVTVSEDEEEVPSRGFLKRQAQLVADAKSRRKILRVPPSRK